MTHRCHAAVRSARSPVFNGLGQGRDSRANLSDKDPCSRQTPISFVGTRAYAIAKGRWRQTQAVSSHGVTRGLAKIDATLEVKHASAATQKCDGRVASAELLQRFTQPMTGRSEASDFGSQSRHCVDHSLFIRLQRSCRTIFPTTWQVLGCCNGPDLPKIRRTPAKIHLATGCRARAIRRARARGRRGSR
jgi:hypothetical protein